MMIDANKLNSQVKNGKTVTIATALKITKATKKNTKPWFEAGYEFFKNDKSGSCYMIGGQSKGKPVYVCIDYTKIVVL